MIASKGIVASDKKSFKGVLLAICLVQFLSVLGYVYSQRRVPPAIEEGINYLKHNIPEDAIVVYPEYNLTEYTNRKVVWTSNFWRLENVFWGGDDLAGKLLLTNKVKYVLIRKDKIYDDRNRRHLRGYPLSFVHRLSTSGVFELKWDNEKLSLWELREKVF